MQKPGFIAWSILMGLVIASLALHLFPLQQNTPQQAAPLSYAAAVNRAAPSVVNIYTSKTIKAPVHPLLNEPFFRRFFERTPMPKQRIQNSLGSGVILDAQGLIITNHHVIADADEILIALQDGRTSNAKVIGQDSETDLALLKIELTDLPVASFASQIGRAHV